jgi:hypothetical protein
MLSPAKIIWVLGFGHWSFQTGHPKILPLSRPICSTPPMSLTNDQIEEQLLQLADALAQMSDMTATAFEQRDEDLKTLKAKVAALEAKVGGE